MRNIIKRFLGLLALGLLAFAPSIWATPAMADPGRGTTVLCYLWNQEKANTFNTPYAPTPEYAFNAQNRAGGISITRTATGVYSVTCTGVGGGSVWGEGGHVQVSSYGEDADDNTFCHVGHWSTGVPDFTATVKCYGRGGGGGGGPGPQDSRFVLLFLW
jgi:hypothetical protein